MKTKMTYARLQERVAASAGISKKEARVLMKALAATVEEGLVSEGKVNLAGLGRFGRKVQSARKGRNPRTGESIDIPEKNRVQFLPEAQLRRFINREFEHLPVVPEPAGQVPAAATASEKETPPPASVHAAVDSATESVAPRSNGQYARLVLAAALLVAALLFFLWPRMQAPVPLPPAVSEPAKVAVSTSSQPADTVSPEPEQPHASTPVSKPAAAVHMPTVAAAEPSPPEPGAATPPVTRYTVRQGDNLWKISNTVYDDAYFWPAIFHANQADLPHPDTLHIGMQLAMPSLDGGRGRLSETDFQLLADGYLQVYRAYRRHAHPRAPYYLWVAYRLRTRWIPESDLLLGENDDLAFIRHLKGQALIH